MYSKEPTSFLEFRTSDAEVTSLPNREAFRVVIGIYNTQPKVGGLFKHYYVWLSDEYATDQLHLSPQYLKEHSGPTIRDVVNVAFEALMKRYEDSGMSVPKEDVIECSNEHGIVVINEGPNYLHPAERKYHP